MKMREDICHVYDESYKLEASLANLPQYLLKIIIKFTSNQILCIDDYSFSLLKDRVIRGCWSSSLPITRSSNTSFFSFFFNWRKKYGGVVVVEDLCQFYA